LFTQVRVVRDTTTVQDYRGAMSRVLKDGSLHYYQHWPVDTSDGHELSDLKERLDNREGREKRLGIVGVDVVLVKIVPFKIDVPMVRPTCPRPGHSGRLIERTRDGYRCAEFGGGREIHDITEKEIKLIWSFGVLVTSTAGNAVFKVSDDDVGFTLLHISPEKYEKLPFQAQIHHDIKSSVAMLLEPYRCYVWISDFGGNLTLHLKKTYRIEPTPAQTNIIDSIQDENVPDRDFITDDPLPLDLEKLMALKANGEEAE
jgi:hypothetical protein